METEFLQFNPLLWVDLETTADKIPAFCAERRERCLIIILNFTHAHFDRLSNYQNDLLIKRISLIKPLVSNVAFSALFLIVLCWNEDLTLWQAIFGPDFIIDLAQILSLWKFTEEYYKQEYPEWPHRRWFPVVLAGEQILGRAVLLRVTRAGKDFTASEVNQFDFKGIRVNQQVFQLDISVQHSTLAALLSCKCCLAHDNPWHILFNGALVAL